MKNRGLRDITKMAGYGRLAIAVEKSSNEKLGPVSTTYAAQGSCPDSCPFFKNGCYAEQGHVGMITQRLNASNPKATPGMIAKAEAAAIDKLSGIRALRLHVVGDGRTKWAVRQLRQAAFRYIKRGIAATGKAPKVWTYTHGWRMVARKIWGKNISVLASCESIGAVRKANERGYAAAMVVQEHPENGKAWKLENYTVIPCPEQTGKAKSCADCRLCWDDQKLLSRNMVIAFATHGAREGAANSALVRIQETMIEAEQDAVDFLMGVTA